MSRTIPSLRGMSAWERVSFDRDWRLMTASEEMAWHNGYFTPREDEILELFEGVYVRRK